MNKNIIDDLKFLSYKGLALAEELEKLKNKLVEVDEGNDVSSEEGKLLVIHSLLEVLERIDKQYYSSCSDIDRMTGDEPGTAYEIGCSTEMMIESDDWHDVSVILRVFRDK